MSDAEAITKSVTESGVLTLTIDRAQRRNALSTAVVEGLTAGLAAAKADPSVRVVVITGAGERAFCAGGDLAGGMGGGGGLPGRLADKAAYAELLRALQGLGKPTIARLNGDAYGGGVGLMLACHLVVAAEDVRVGLPEIKVGLWPMMVTALLVRHVGRKTAAELMLLGEKHAAEEARALGLINRVVPRVELDAAVGRWAEALAGQSPAVMKLGLDALNETADLALDPALDALRDRLQINTMLADAAEGITAFIQKRPPQWKGQ
ncbi:MAG: enoyl-CoA hydratase/isomerase family protein [Myxococcales bacterium]|nr:enoyl-CoA hydratase/isomerase family protein [Myxococcales bacterium]